MTCTVNYVSSESRTFRLSDTSERIKVFLEKWVCNANDLNPLSHGWTPTEVAERKVSRHKEGYLQKKAKPEYFTASLELGSAVLKLPTDYTGTHSDYDSDDYKFVGTLVEDEGGKLYIETNLLKVREIDQQLLLKKVQEGKITIGVAPDVDVVEHLKDQFNENVKHGRLGKHGLRYSH
jgi:hypothetical protein